MAAKRQMSYLFETYHLYPPSLALSTCLKSEVCQLYVLTAINTLQKTVQSRNPLFSRHVITLRHENLIHKIFFFKLTT